MESKLGNRTLYYSVHGGTIYAVVPHDGDPDGSARRDFERHLDAVGVPYKKIEHDDPDIHPISHHVESPHNEKHAPANVARHGMVPTGVVAAKDAQIAQLERALTAMDASSKAEIAKIRAEVDAMIKAAKGGKS